MQLTATDHRVVEDPQHGSSQGLRTVDTDEDRPGGVQAPLAQPDE
jgi:hypothetical protein